MSTIKKYRVQMNDSETKGPSTVFPGILTEQPINQDDATCHYNVAIEDHQIADFEAAMDADADVLRYFPITANA